MDEAVKNRLDALARRTGVSRSNLAAEAIAEYLAVNEWQISGVEAALKGLDQGERFDHDSVRKWVESWGSENELEAPWRPGS